MQPVSEEITTYAGLISRAIALILDGFILSVPTVLILLVNGLATRTEHSVEISLDILPVAAILVMSWLYFAGMHSSAGQATLGKKAMGIIVTCPNGYRITFPHASMRFLGKILSELTLGVGFLMPLFTEKKRALHDMIGGTLVWNKPK